MTHKHFDMHALTDEYDELPRHQVSQIQAYVNDRHRPCNFLQSMLENDLERTVAYADSQNRQLLHVWVKLLFNNIPRGCWGSTEKVEAWLRK